MTDPVINVVISLAQPSTPRRYRQYLKRLPRPKLLRLASELKLEAGKTRTERRWPIENLATAYGSAALTNNRKEHNE